MKQETFEREMKVAETQGNIRETRGLNWVMLSFAAIIITILFVIFAAQLIPTSFYQKMTEPDPAASPVQQPR